MADIVERLREDARGGHAYHELSDEAADEIERLNLECSASMTEIGNLRAEIERLTKELDYWERIGRDKLDAELIRGLAAEAAALTGTP